MKLIDVNMFQDKIKYIDYTKYLARKASQGNPPKERLDWKEARDYWLFDSPMARGNDFNRKAWREEWYPTWEIQLDNGKFLDEYNKETKKLYQEKLPHLKILRKKHL